MCDGAVWLRLAGSTWAHPRQLTLELVVALFLTFLGCLLLLLKGGVVGGDELVLVRALVVMVTQHGLKQVQVLAKAAEPMASTVKMSTRMGTSTWLMAAAPAESIMHQA